MSNQIVSPEKTLTPTETSIINDISTITSGAAQAITLATKANLWTAIVGFFTALPAILSLLQSFMAWVNAMSGNNPQAFISQLGLTFSQLSKAKTPEDQNAAAQALATIISKLPS